MNKKTFYITTAIDYASGSPHIGHAYEKIGADILARWKRLTNYETFFLTGTDEHGQKIVEKAGESGLSVEDFSHREAQKFIQLTKDLNLSNDFFIRTTNDDHKQYVKEMLQKSFDNGDIYLADYEGLYCVGCERYYTQDELIDGKICPDHQKEVQYVKEQNYFFKLSKYQEKLLELYQSNPEFISPKNRTQEIINRVEEGLQDISISRRKETLTWGIELPFDSEHVTYVWFDALFNYLSALNTNEKENMWPADVHLIGKDIMWFHTVYWPAFLMSVDKLMPHKVFAHGMVLDANGNKMSKALGNIVDPYEEIDYGGLDEFRFYLAYLGSFGEDLRYSQEGFVSKINNELNDDLGNLVSRVHAMTNKYFQGIVPKQNGHEEIDEKLISNFSSLFENFNIHMNALEYNKALEVLWEVIRQTNAYINEVMPWKEESPERLETVMNILVSAVKVFGTYLTPFMPQKVEKLNIQYNFDYQPQFDFSHIQEGHTLGEKENLFSKIKLEKPEKSQEEPKKEGFSKLNLKVGKILDVKQHPEAEKLYIETIDVGEEEPRQIISGLKDHYSRDELLNRKVIVVANLKPAKLRGEKSYGMVLLAEDNKGNLGFLETEASVGSQVSCGDEVADNQTKIKVDEFFKYKLIANGETITYNDSPLKVEEEKLSVENNIEGEVK